MALLQVISSLILFPLLSSAKSIPATFLECEALDLSHTLNGKGPVYPIPHYVQNNYKSEDLVKEETIATKTSGSIYLFYGKFSMAEHISTHIDSPQHVVANRQVANGNDPIDKVPIHKLVGEACVVDVPEHGRETLDYKLTVDDLKAWEARHGRIDEGCFVLLRTGLSKYWNDEQRYFGAATKEDVHTLSEIGFPYKLHWPGFSYESAAWLVANREFVGVGIDAVSFDTGNLNDFAKSAHTEILGSNRIGIENLANLDKLPARGATMIALPLKMENSSGSPARVIAYGWRGESDPCSMNYKSGAMQIRAGMFMTFVLLTIFAM